MTGHWTGWTPDGWTPGPRTAEGMGGHRMVDADDDGRHGRHPGIPTTAPTPLPLGTVPKFCRADAAWGDQQAGQLKRRDTAKGLAAAATSSCRATFRGSAGASAHCSRVLDLDGTSGGQWDYGR